MSSPPDPAWAGTASDRSALPILEDESYHFQCPLYRTGLRDQCNMPRYVVGRILEAHER